jgi:hypothetical protein
MDMRANDCVQNGRTLQKGCALLSSCSPAQLPECLECSPLNACRPLLPRAPLPPPLLASPLPPCSQAAPLFTPYTLPGGTQLQHRIVYAPLTRCRAFNSIPQPNAALYYSQRATPGGLVLSEGTLLSDRAYGYPCTPGGCPGCRQRALFCSFLGTSALERVGSLGRWGPQSEACVTARVQAL